MKRKIKISKAIALGLVSLSAISLASCGGNSESTTPSESSSSGASNSSQSSSSQKNEKNETRPLTMASQEVDQVFSPFFSSSTADASVVSMTQISMLTNDKTGNPKTRKQGASVVTYDYEIKYDSTSNTSTYYFVLDNSIKFSNGSALTMKDVLFNLYVYLDPVYNGSSTMYSTDIVGLKQYRTQTDSESEQDSYMDQFNSQATQRINDLCDAFDDIYDNLGANEDLSVELLKTKLKAYEEENGYDSLVKDFEKIDSLFKEELNNDYKSAKSASVEDYKDQFLDSKGNIQTFTHSDGSSSTTPFETTAEIFLYNEGFITWNKKDCEFSFKAHNSLSEIRQLSETECINLVYNAYMPEQLTTVATQWQTASEIKEYIANELSKEYIESNGKKYNNISGIKFANKNDSVTVNGTTYSKAEYNSDGSAKNNEVLSITINGEDPKAIWNFSFAVAPMYYYSNSEQIAKFDYESNFGVSYNDQNFRDTVLKDSTKIKVPMGAGAYKASSSNGKEVVPGTFYDGTTIYFERNSYFRDGETGEAPNIKNIYFRVVPTESVLSSLYSGSVDYCEPSAKPDTVSELQGKQSEGFETISNKTQGYGYVGINASKVKSLYVRQAIMHSINVDDIVSYYGTTASRINRSMSKESWAYPEGCTAYYPSVFEAVPSDLSVVSPNYKKFVEDNNIAVGTKFTDAQAKSFIKYLITEIGGIKANADGAYTDLSYTFTIAGASEDHPAYTAFKKAATLLNSCGLQITVKKDSQALTKLTSGALEVWAAAWSSSLDPDMYQVYHKNSSATAILNWGYNAILNDTTTYATENKLINELSSKIMEARKTTVQSTRTAIYKECLDIVMQLAIELPTYQREDLSAFNGKQLDKNSLVTGDDLTSYTGVTSRIWRANEIA